MFQGYASIVELSDGLIEFLVLHLCNVHSWSDHGMQDIICQTVNGGRAMIEVNY